MEILNQKNYKILSTLLQTNDTSVIIATNSNSIPLSKTNFGLIVISNSTGLACRFGLSTKVSWEKLMEKIKTAEYIMRELK